MVFDGEHRERHDRLSAGQAVFAHGFTVGLDADGAGDVPAHSSHPYATEWQHRVRMVQERGPMNKRVECECGWSFEGDEGSIVAAVEDHCEQVHDGRVPEPEQILAVAKPVPERPA